MHEQRDALERLGRAVLERRRRVGATQETVTRHGGPSDRTLRALENGTAGAPSQTTLRALDHGLFWDLGTAGNVYHGVMSVSAAVDARQVATVRSSATTLTSGTAVALGGGGDTAVAEPPPPEPRFPKVPRNPSEAAALIELTGGTMTPAQARAAVSNALTALLGLPNPTDAEVEARDTVWDAMLILMEADRKGR